MFAIRQREYGDRISGLVNRLWRRLAPLVATVAVAVVVGLNQDRLPSAPTALYLAAAPAVLVLGFVAARGMWLCVGAYIALSVLYPAKGFMSIGPLDIRFSDLAYAAMLAWIVVLVARGEVLPARSIGQLWLLLYLGVAGFTLFVIAVTAPDDFQRSLVAWLRLVATFSLVFIVPCAVRDREDRRRLLSVILVCLASAVGYAVSKEGVAHGFGARVRGAHGPNTTGLMAALLVIAALHAPVPARRGLRLLMAAIGVAGLASTRSIGSVVAVGLVVGLYGAKQAGVSLADRRSTGLVPARMLFAAFLVVAVVTVLRPANLPTSEGFKQSSTAARLIAADTGIELLKEHPFAGVGWQRSSLSHVVASPELSDRLRARWPGVNPAFFPDRRTTTVHSAYVQVGAETGLLGIVVFIAMFVKLRRELWRLVARTTSDVADRALAGVLFLFLLAIAVWWNDNPFFGAQPETVLAAVFLGVFASYRETVTPKLTAADHSSRQDAARSPVD